MATEEMMERGSAPPPIFATPRPIVACNGSSRSRSMIVAARAGKFVLWRL